MIDLEIHSRENSEESEQFLKENSERLSNQCIYVYKLLLRGEKLTVPKALGLGIMSLPRRIMDLKVSGANIKDEWIKDSNGKRIMKEWSIEIPKPISKAELQQFWNDFQSENPTPVIPIESNSRFTQTEFNF